MIGSRQTQPADLDRRSQYVRLQAVPLVLVALAILLICASQPSFAQSPFGVGIAEQPLTTSREGVFGWIAQMQTAFYRQLTDLVQAIKENPAGVWILAGVSFLYGVFHAAGPGHGKAIVSSYALADGQVLRRGIILAFLSAQAQAITAITLILIAAVILNLTSIAITDTARALEIGSYALVTALGLWLVWAKIVRPLYRRLSTMQSSGIVAELISFAPRSAQAHASHDPSHHAFQEQGLDHSNHHDHHGHTHHHVHEAHGDHAVCSSCGHAHAPAPSALSEPLSGQRALAVIVSIGLRPCTGALVILVFAFSQGLLWAGITATFAMALGTGLTVAVLASLAVFARDTAVKVSGGSSSKWARLIHTGVEGFAALLVLTFGAVLLANALS